MKRVSLVFLGGGLGAVLRAVLITATAPWAGAFPLGVLTANLLGAVALGAVYIAADEMQLLGSGARLFLAVGLLGGFTTFSTFALGANDLVSSGTPGSGSLYLSVSVVGGVVAVGAGMVLMRVAARRWIVHAQEPTALDDGQPDEVETY